MVSGYSTTAVNVFGIIGIAVSLCYMYFIGNLNGITIKFKSIY
jgi:hypothetical protein